LTPNVGGGFIQDALDFGFVIISLFINLGVLAWMFVRLDRIIVENGSLDLYLNFIGRTAGWQLLAYIIYACFYALI